MWVQAGFTPDTFWHQTPASFALSMKAVRKRLEREDDDRLVMAWQTAALCGAAQAGKLKPLKHYLRKPGPKQKQSDMLAILKEFQARGAGMKITPLKR